MRSTHTKAEHLRLVIGKVVRMLAQQGITVTQRGTGAYCKFNNSTGKAELINLPVIPPDPSDKFVAALHGYLDHEVAHALETNSKDWQSSLVDPNNISTTGKGFRNKVINVVEDVRIENEMPKRFPGSLANLEAVRQFLIDEVWQPQLDRMDMSDPAQEGKIRTVVLVPYLRAVGGHKACRMWVDEKGLERFFEPLNKAIPDLADRFRALTSTADAARLADELIAAIQPPPKEKQPDEPDEEDGEDQSLGDADGGTAEDDPLEPQDNGQDETPDADDQGDGDGEGDGGSASDDDKEDGGNGGDKDKKGDSNQPPSKQGGDKEKDKDKKLPKTKLGEAMKLLKPAQRKAIFLYNKKRMDVKEIAGSMKISEADASRHLKDARRRLSLIMKEM